jgi:hypothetical protein
MADKPTTQDVLLAKMQALVGRHRPAADGDSDEIPVLTQIVGPMTPMTSAAPMPPDPEPPAQASSNAQELGALLEAHLLTALTREFAEQLQPHLQTYISNAIRDVLQREGNQLAHGIAARVGELMREHFERSR